MGLDIYGARFLLAEKSRGVAFGRTLTLGRQGIYMRKSLYGIFLESLGVQSTVSEYADDFFRGVGANPLIPMDASSYEGAVIIHDMNEPIDAKYHGAFDTVVDGGTLEHVFNFPIALRNCMEMVKPGGQLILMTPWHNFSGHGFYQFSPELIFNALSEQNGYCVEKMLIAAEGSWYSVKNPGEIKRRTEIVTRDPVLLYVTARRISNNPVFAHWPQQSDYSSAWERGNYTNDAKATTLSLESRIVDQFPFMESIQASWRTHKHRRSLSLVRNPCFERICSSKILPY